MLAANRVIFSENTPWVFLTGCEAPIVKKLNQHFEVVNVWKLGKQLTDVFSLTLPFPSSRLY